MDKWDYMKLKTFCTTKEMVSKLKRTPTFICISLVSNAVKYLFMSLSGHPHIFLGEILREF
jgi:hypothetical protein